MKIKSILSVLLLSAIFFVGCKKDDNDVPETVSLIGSWQLQSKTKDGNIAQLEPCEMETVFSFANAGVFSSSLKSMDSETQECSVAELTTGTYTAMGNSITLNFDSKEQVGTYTLTSKTFVFTYTNDGSSQVMNFTRVE